MIFLGMLKSSVDTLDMASSSWKRLQTGQVAVQ